MSHSKNLKGYPSLHLAYDQIKNVLADQRQTASVLESKAFNFLTVATAITGIVIPLGFNRLTHDTLWLLAVLIIPIALYMYAWSLFRNVYQLQAFEKLGDPKGSRDYMDLEPEQFMLEAIEQIDEAFQKNETILEGKRKALSRLLPVVACEIALLLLWEGCVLGFTI